MTNKIFNLIFCFIICGNFIFSQVPENGTVIIDDKFTSLNTSYIPVYLEGNANGSSSVLNEQLKLEAKSINVAFALAHPVTASGHFYAEVSFDKDNCAGLALIKNTNGKPDINNFTSILVNTNPVTGIVSVEVSDRQNGVLNVLDNTKTISDKTTRYKTLLNNRYSVPFSSTDKKIRIFRDDLSGFFHFYYAVKKNINGNWYSDWMELAPSKDWNAAGSTFFAAPLIKTSNISSAQVNFDNLRVVQKPKQDISDLSSGFSIKYRDYNWSGTTGNAYVITFDNRFKYHNDDIKFVFWEMSNWVPVWHLNNQLLFSYEFVETWTNDNSKGCFEPMSDRLRAFNNVEVLEDNRVRKVLKWSYSLVNPDYRFPSSVGTQSPDIEEIYTIYPDGLILRHIKYKAKLDDPAWSNWNELEESIVIAGTQSKPSDHIYTLPATIMDLKGNIKNYTRSWYDSNKLSGGKNFSTSDRKTIENWAQMIESIHFNTSPDVFNVFSNSGNAQLFSGLRATTDISWHSYDYQMSHWPVNKEPYQESFKSNTTWSAQVSHSSLSGVEHWNDGSDGFRWTNNFKMDTDGRKYREWVSLVGLNDPFDNKSLTDKTSSWLLPASITMLDQLTTGFSGNDFSKKEIILQSISADKRAYFVVDPSLNKNTVINPVIRFKDFGNYNEAVYLNNILLKKGIDYESSILGNDLLLWIEKQFNTSATVEIKASETSGFSASKDAPSSTELLANYPNPFNPSTTISYSIDKQGFVSLKVYDVLGNEVAVLVDREMAAGNYSVRFNASNLAGGIYIYKLSSGGFTSAKKLMLMK